MELRRQALFAGVTVCDGFVPTRIKQGVRLPFLPDSVDKVVLVRTHARVEYIRVKREVVIGIEVDSGRELIEPKLSIPPQDVRYLTRGVPTCESLKQRIVKKRRGREIQR